MFFTAINTLSHNIASIDLDAITKDALQSRGEDIAELNRDQLRKGQRSDLSFLPDYSIKSVEKFGKPAGPIRLYDKGDFYGEMKPEFAEHDFTIQNDDQKAEYLQYHAGKDKQGYGEKILGLSVPSIDELAQDSLGSIQYGLRTAMTK